MAADGTGLSNPVNGLAREVTESAKEVTEVAAEVSGLSGPETWLGREVIGGREK